MTEYQKQLKELDVKDRIRKNLSKIKELMLRKAKYKSLTQLRADKKDEFIELINDQIVEKENEILKLFDEVKE